jgi:UDP-2,3-diacylglucosamine pyrophosphatase LpxH
MARFIELCGGEEIFALSSPNEKDNLSLMQVFNNCMAIKYIREMLSTNSAVKDRVEQDMQNEGYVGSAESFWIEKWLLNGEQDYPGYVVDEDPAAGKYDTLWINYWSATDGRNKKVLIPFLNDLTGLSLTADMPEDLLNRFYELLDRFYMDERTEQLENYDMVDRLRYYFAYFDVMNEGLWENEAFVDLIVQERFNVQSHAEWNGYDEAHKQMTAYWFFANYYAADMKFEKYYDTIHCPTHTNQDIQAKVGELFEAMTGVSAEDRLTTLVAALYKRSYETDSTSVVPGFEDLKIAGYFKATNNTSSLIVSDEILSYYKDAFAKEEELMHGGDKDYKQEIAEHEDGMWAFAIAPMPTDRAAVRRLMELHYEKGGADVDVKFSMHNAVMSTLGSFDDMIEVLAQVFLWVGLGFAVFSSFLLMNFISTSISYKKREIGILRAVGARSSDVFKIFFSESFIIAFINFVLAVAASLTTVILLNGYMRGEGINITLLNFGVRQVALMLGVSVLVALLASFLPVWRIAKKKPVDAIKDR